MAPRKRKSTSQTDPEEEIQHHPDASSATRKKRKVNWATIDKGGPFEGFKLKAAKMKTPKKSTLAYKRQKTAKSANADTESWRDGPLDADIVQKNPFPESELSETHFSVEPMAEWESTQRYRKFTISEAEFEVNQLIFVAPVGDAQPMVGKVLEVRAGDALHVYLRVYWMYWPEDLPGGRQPHHGDSELIASNHMDIIEALTVSDKAEVVHWDEDPDKSAWPMKDQLFWRQTYDLGKPAASRLSKLRPFCVDKAPCNPDEPLVNCPSCSGWLHARCLEEQAVKEAHEKNISPAKGSPPKAKKKGARKSSSGAAFVASLTAQESGKIVITVTDKRLGQDNRRWNVDVNCLLCQNLIEAADDELPQQPEEVTTEPTESLAASTTDNDEVDSVVGKHDATEREASLPTSVTAAADAVQNAVQNAVPSARGRGRPRKRKRASSAAEATSALVTGSENIVRSAKPRATAPSIMAATPATGAPSESIFQSGIKSVKRLLWRSS